MKGENWKTAVNSISRSKHQSGEKCIGKNDNTAEKKGKKIIKGNHERGKRGNKHWNIGGITKHLK